MNKNSHVFDFLVRPISETPVGVCVVYGSERFLKTLAIKHLTSGNGDETSEFSVTKFDSSNSWSDVHDELSTRSLFGGDGPRIVIVDDADKFVSENRSRLEDFAEGSGGTGLLVLIVDTWQKTLRLYKRVEKSGFQINCGPPTKSGKSKKTDPAKVNEWLIARAQDEYDFELPKAAGQLLIDVTECEFGRMDMELQKIALYADNKKKVSLPKIKKIVGGWRNRTMWEAVDAALAGETGKSLDLLDLIFRGGEHPLGLFGSMSWSLRRYANATEEVLRQMRGGRRPNMQAALASAGLTGWNAGNAEGQLKQIGSVRAKKISQWMLEADLQLKRSHAYPHRGRLVLEKLFVQLSKELHGKL